jgi:anti-sigma regulatory factor (Ser/Thr protein kinase)
LGRRGGVERGFGGVTAVSGEFRREIDALGEVFAFLETFTDGQEVDEKTAFCINLVVEELFTNMVRHNEGGGDQITISIERRDNRLLLELVDTDVEPFDPETAEVPPVDAGIDERRPGGLGIYLVQSMVDDLNYDYETEGRRMRIKVTKTLEN